MRLLYIIVRTFPFWAIPIGLGLIATAMQVKKKKVMGSIGAVLILASIAFLYFQGHRKAVPYLHELMQDSR